MGGQCLEGSAATSKFVRKWGTEFVGKRVVSFSAFICGGLISVRGVRRTHGD
jgi:hypothetical protein